MRPTRPRPRGGARPRAARADAEGAELARAHAQLRAAKGEFVRVPPELIDIGFARVRDLRDARDLVAALGVPEWKAQCVMRAVTVRRVAESELAASTLEARVDALAERADDVRRALDAVQNATHREHMEAGRALSALSVSARCSEQPAPWPPSPHWLPPEGKKSHSTSSAAM